MTLNTFENMTGELATAFQRTVGSCAVGTDFEMFS